MQKLKVILKRILIITTLFCIMFPMFLPISVQADVVSVDQIGQAVAQVAREVVLTGNSYGILRYSNNGNRNSIVNWRLVTGEQTTLGGSERISKTLDRPSLCADCGSFCAGIYKIVLGNKFKNIDRYTQAFAWKENPPQEFEMISKSERKPGDIVASDGHCAIYLGEGEIAHASGMNQKAPDKQIIISDIGDNLIYTYRLREKAANEFEGINTIVDWTKLGLSSLYSEGFYYNGLGRKRRI